MTGVSALSDGSPVDVANLKEIQERNAQDQNITTRMLPVNEMPAEVVSVPPGTPEPLTRMDYVQKGTNIPLGTHSDEIGSTAGNETYVFVTKWGSSGTGDGQFDASYGVAVGSSGNVFVTDELNKRIQKFAPSSANPRLSTSPVLPPTAPHR
ncbi:MAG: hypothetical protein STSR0009_00710 [Methanoregula sp.]